MKKPASTAYQRLRALRGSEPSAKDVPRRNLAEQLKAGALANAGRDLAIAEEWFPLEEEAWQRRQKPRTKAKK